MIIEAKPLAPLDASEAEALQTAVERYRTNKVIPPVNATTSSVAYQQAQQAAQATTANKP